MTTSAERLEQTRARLLDAVIESLAEVGYAGTSTTEVARRSGLTRGAQLHHFGTKDQMMIAAAEHLNAKARTAEIVAALDERVGDTQRLHTALALLAEIASGPQPTAYVELWVAARTNPELADVLRDGDVIARDNVRALFGPKILAKAGPAFDGLLDTAMYAMRGMALDTHIATNEDRQARRDLITGLEKYLDRMLEATD